MYRIYLILNRSLLTHLVPQMAHRNIIHWNCQGIQANLNELQIIAHEFNVVIFCLQESLLAPNKQLTFEHNTAYLKFSNTTSDTRPSGGVSILVHNTIPNSPVFLTTTLQAEGTTVTFNQTISICNITGGAVEPALC